MKLRLIFLAISDILPPIAVAGVSKIRREGQVFMGLSVSFSTLQDTTKTQNEVSRKVFSSPLLGKCFLLLLAIGTAGTIAVGLWGMYQVPDHKLYQLSLGFVVLGIGLIGLLKAASEMFEHHRTDS